MENSNGIQRQRKRKRKRQVRRIVKIKAGKKYSFLNSFNQENSVMIHEGSDFFHKYYFPYEEDIQDHFELKTTALVGGMGSGKSSTFRFLVEFIRDYWDRDNVNAVLTDNVQLAMENITNHKYQIFVIDDAMTKQDSRRAMSDENVTATQQFMIIRHIAKEIGFGGVIYVIWCFQDLSGIDKRFRNTCDVTLFKQYYIEYDSQINRLIKDKESIEFLKFITEKQGFNEFEYRSYGVGYTKWGSIINIKTPYIPEKEFKIEILDSNLKKEAITNELIDNIIESGLEQEQSQLAYGYLYNIKEKRKELEAYNFSQTDFQRILWRAKAKSHQNGNLNTIGKEEYYLYKLIKFFRNVEKMTYQELEEEFEIPHSYIHRLESRIDKAMMI